MSAHRFHSDWSQSTPQLIDPGNAKALPNSQCGHIDLVTTAAETRTLAAPTKAGLDLSLNFFTDGGDCVITVATAYNAVGSTTITLADAGDWVKLESRAYGTVFRWVLAGFDGVALAAMDITALSIGGTAVDATALEINRAADVSSRLVNLAVSTAITEAAHEGRTILMTGAGSARTFTLPAATGSGARYRFVVGEVNTSNYLIKSVVGTDLMKGVILGDDGGGVTTALVWAAGATDDTITLNGTTMGGVSIGDWVELEDISATSWAVRGVVQQSGSEVTMFSDTVT